MAIEGCSLLLELCRYPILGKILYRFLTCGRGSNSITYGINEGLGPHGMVCSILFWRRWPAPMWHMPFAGRCHRPARLVHLGFLTRDMQ